MFTTVRPERTTGILENTTPGIHPGFVDADRWIVTGHPTEWRDNVRAARNTVRDYFQPIVNEWGPTTNPASEVPMPSVVTDDIGNRFRPTGVLQNHWEINETLGDIAYDYNDIFNSPGVEAPITFTNNTWAEQDPSTMSATDYGNWKRAKVALIVANSAFIATEDLSGPAAYIRFAVTRINARNTVLPRLPYEFHSEHRHPLSTATSLVEEILVGNLERYISAEIDRVYRTAARAHTITVTATTEADAAEVTATHGEPINWHLRGDGMWVGIGIVNQDNTFTPTEAGQTIQFRGTRTSHNWNNGTTLTPGMVVRQEFGTSPDAEVYSWDSWQKGKRRPLTKLKKTEQTLTEERKPKPRDPEQLRLFE